MKLTRFAEAAEWLARAQAPLEENEAANSLMVGIALRLAEHPDRIKHAPYLAMVEEAGALCATAVMTPPHRVIVYRAPNSGTPPLLPIIDSLRAENWQVPGVIAESGTAAAFAALWTERTGLAHRPGMSQRIYELRQVTPPTGVPGHFRAATEQETELVADWAYNFMLDACLPASQEDARSIADLRIGDRDIFFWEDEGHPVSMAAKTRHSTRGVTVSLVYTPPELRRRGYASACVAALSQHLLDAGWQFCSLYTDLSNPTSNAIYQQIGFRPVCDSNEYEFDMSGKE